MHPVVVHPVVQRMVITTQNHPHAVQVTVIRNRLPVVRVMKTAIQNPLPVVQAKGIASLKPQPAAPHAEAGAIENFMFPVL
jgi:hypothetical protein